MSTKRILTCDLCGESDTIAKCELSEKTIATLVRPIFMAVCGSSEWFSREGGSVDACRQCVTKLNDMIEKFTTTRV